MWQDQIQGIGVEGSPIATWYLSSKICGGVAWGLGRLGKCRKVLGDLGLAGEVGPESMRRLEGSRGAKGARQETEEKKASSVSRRRPASFTVCWIGNERCSICTAEKKNSQDGAGTKGTDCDRNSDERIDIRGARGSIALSFVARRSSILGNVGGSRPRRHFVFVATELSSFRPAFVS